MNPLLALVCYEGIIYAGEAAERWDVYKRAQRNAKEAGVPLLVVGCPKWGLHHGHGDATLDIEHKWWCRCPNPVVMDVRTIDKHFAPKSVVMFSSHVLEHLSAEDAEQVVNLMDKVSIAQYHCFPSKLSIVAWMAPTHLSWPTTTKQGQITFANREGRV
jgi:hypothetical protein